MAIMLSYSNLECVPKMIGNYMVWTKSGFESAYWNGAEFIVGKRFVTDEVYYWAEIPSVECLDFNYGKEI